MDPNFDNFNLKIGSVDTNPSSDLLGRLRKIILFREYNKANNYLRVREKDKPFYETLFRFLRPSFLKIVQELGYKDYNIKEYWQQKYHKGDFHDLHCHSVDRPEFSFVYFIKCPKGSSPLVFTKSGKKIKAEEGKVVIFPGWIRHHVPKNKCEGRITMAGIIFYRQ